MRLMPEGSPSRRTNNRTGDADWQAHAAACGAASRGRPDRLANSSPPTYKRLEYGEGRPDCGLW
jgi:hypothetical protein